MGKSRLLVWCVAVAACGRIGFNPPAGGVGDGMLVDGGPMRSCTGLASICHVR
jgi:hypothetical protein